MMCINTVHFVHSCYNKLMSTDVGAIRTYFAKLGLDAEIADIYLALHTHGPQSISQLSRNARVERTRIYRLIDQLMDSHLIELESHNTRGTLKAAPIANLHILITQKEQELKSLQDELGLIEQVLSRNSLSSPVTRVQFYEGSEASKQIRHNMLHANTELLSVLYKDIAQESDPAVADRWLKNASEQKLRVRIIYDKQHKQTMQRSQSNTFPDTWQVRYVSSQVFPVTHSITTYDDVVASLHWHDNQLYGLEVYGADTASAQRAFFELLWERSDLT